MVVQSWARFLAQTVHAHDQQQENNEVLAPNSNLNLAGS